MTNSLSLGGVFPTNPVKSRINVKHTPTEILYNLSRINLDGSKVVITTEFY